MIDSKWNELTYFDDYNMNEDYRKECFDYMVSGGDLVIPIPNENNMNIIEEHFTENGRMVFREIWKYGMYIKRLKESGIEDIVYPDTVTIFVDDNIIPLHSMNLYIMKNKRGNYESYCEYMEKVNQKNNTEAMQFILEVLSDRGFDMKFDDEAVVRGVDSVGYSMIENERKFVLIHDDTSDSDLHVRLMVLYLNVDFGSQRLISLDLQDLTDTDSLIRMVDLFEGTINFIIKREQ